MDITTFVLLYEERKNIIKKPSLNSKKIKPYLTKIKKRFNTSKYRNMEGRGMLMKFLSDLEYLHNNLLYIENKDPSTLDKEDVEDANKNFKNAKDYLSSKDDALERMNLSKEKKSLRKS